MTCAAYAPRTLVDRTSPVSVCSPGFAPTLQVSAARPRASLTARAGDTTPDVVAKWSGAFGTGFPYTSVTKAYSRRVPAGSRGRVAPGPASSNDRFAGAPGAAVAVSRIALSVPRACTPSVCRPAERPMVQRTVPIPSESVASALSTTEPADGESVSAAPATPLPLESTTRTLTALGSVAPAAARCASPATSTMPAGRPAPATAVITTGTML